VSPLESYPLSPLIRDEFAFLNALPQTTAHHNQDPVASASSEVTQAEFDADHLTSGCNVKDVALGKSLPSKDSQFRQHGMQRSNFFNIPSYYMENLLEIHVAAVKKLTAEPKREKSKNTAAEEAIKKLTLAMKGKKAKRVHKKPVAKQASSGGRAKKSVGSVGPSQKRGIAKEQAGKGRQGR
jgi:hypothetical protein